MIEFISEHAAFYIALGFEWGVRRGNWTLKILAQKYMRDYINSEHLFTLRIARRLIAE